MGQQHVRLLIIDSRPVIRRGLREILRSHEDMEIAGEAESISDALDWNPQIAPSVILMELRWPYNQAYEAVQSLRDGFSARCIAFTDQEDWSLAAMWMQAGGSGYITKRASEAEIVKAIRRVSGGATYLSPLLSITKQASESTEFNSLSEREVEVIGLVAAGYSSTQIAETLHISPKTVETYRSRISRKLGLHTRTELVHYAAEHGLFKLAENAAN